MKTLLRISLTFLALCLGMPALADPAPQWKLIQRVGEVWITGEEFQPIAVTTNLAIPERSVIVTGQKGRAILNRGTEQIILQPNSRLVIPETKDKTTRLMQSRGSALFRVDRKQMPHFRVDTPYLAAVVKGTIFVVSVTEQSARIEVNEGAVSVATAKGEAETLVRPGMIAEVKATSAVVIDLTDESGTTRRIVDRQDTTPPAPTERIDLGPVGGSGNDGSSGPGGPHKEAAFNNLQLRDTFVPNSDRRMLLLRTSSPETSIMEYAVDSATKEQMKLQEDKRMARFSNLENIVQTNVVDAAASNLENVNVSSGKNFLKKTNVNVDSPFASSAIQNLILGGVGILVAFQLLKTLARRKRV